MVKCEDIKDLLMGNTSLTTKDNTHRRQNFDGLVIDNEGNIEMEELDNEYSNVMILKNYLVNY